MTCTHPNPDLCSLLDAHIVGRSWDIWQGNVLTPEECEVYRQLWMSLAGIEKLPDHLIPTITTRAGNFIKSSTRHVTAGAKKVSQSEYDKRISVCESCSLLTEARKCADMKCGCPVDKKAWWETEDCPQERWPELQTEITIESAKAREPELHLPHPIAKHVTRWAVGITTAPRKQSTLHRCVDSVLRAGFDPVVFAEPDTPCNVPLHVRIVRRPHTIATPAFTASALGPDGRFGAWQNWYQSLKDLLELYPFAEAVCIFQDDCVLTRGVREFLEHDLWPSDRTGTVSIYAPNFPGYEQAGVTGCKRVVGRHLMGAVANIFPRDVAEQIINTKSLSEWRGAAKGEQPVPHLKKAIDTYIGHAVAELDKNTYYYTPSLAQHISATSSIGHGGSHGKRRSERFPGEGGTAWGAFQDHVPWVRFNLPSGNQRFAGGEPVLSTARNSIPVGVVIPACGSADLTARCLEHLKKNTGVVLRVVYVDNGSPPGTVEQVKLAAFDLELDMLVIRNETNLGFTVAANQGIRELSGEHRKHHVLLLNNDAFVGPGCVDAMLKHLEWHPQVAATGPLTGDRGHQSLRNESRKKLSGIKGELPPLHDPNASAKACSRVYVTTENMLTGFCCLKHRDAIADVGLLDEDPGYAGGLGTDDDWCHRARKQGWKLLLCYDAYAAHLHSESFRRLGMDRKRMQQQAMKTLRSKAT